MAGIFDYLLDAPSGKQVVPRNMQQVAPAMKEVFGERLPNAALEGPADAAGQAAKRGLLSRVLGVAAGPVGVGVQAATHAGDLNEGEDAIVKQRQDAERDAYYTANPQEARDAMSYGQGVGQRAAQAGINYAYDQTQKGDQGSGDGKLLMTQETKTAPTTPEVPPEVVEHAKKQTEAKRQVVQQGTVKALQTNQVSRPELAEEIVKADVQRTGKELTPDAFKARVAEETSNMKSMDNNDLSRYVSYALVAAGLIASFADKSGKAGDAFSASFNRQLDRNLQNGINNSKIQAKATENAQKNAIKTYELKQGDRKLDQGDKTLANDEKRTDGQLGFWKDSADLGRERIAVSREGNSIQAANANATNGLRSAQMDLNRELAAQRQQNSDRDFGLKKESLAIRKAKADAAGDSFKAPEISSKAAQDLVASRAKGTGIPIAKSALPQVAEQLRVLIKDDPRGYAENPTKFHDRAIKQAGLQQTGNTSLWDDRELAFPK
uniref:Virion protein n=3 Tax=unclassified bacterial viruses TaxID=12333 RepID=A0AAU6W0D1_9VIRU